MKTTLFVMLFVCSSVAQACDPADIISFQVKLDAGNSLNADVGWRNHFNFLRIMKVLPNVVTLEVPRAALVGGAFSDESSFLAAVEKSLRFPASNLYLRAVGHWMNGLAESLGRPELAGLFFGWVVNQVALSYGTSADGQRTATGLSSQHIVRSQLFGLFASLQELMRLEDKGAGHVVLRATSFPLLNLFRRNEQFSPLLKIALDLPSATMDINVAGGSTRLDVQRVPGAEDSEAFLWIPLPEGAGDRLPRDLPWTLKFGLNGHPLAVVFGLSRKLQQKLTSDALWYERLLVPLVAETLRVAYLNGPTSVFRERIGVDSPEAYEQAIRVLLTSTLALYPTETRDALFVAILRAVETNPQITFATIEEVARKYQLPIYLCATIAKDPDFHLAWPDYQYRKRSVLPPTRAFAVYVGTNEDDVAEMYRLNGVDPETNRDLLSHSTGALKRGRRE